MKLERKPLVINVAANPFDVAFSREIRNVTKMELVYFKLMGLNTANIPLNLWIKVEGMTGLGSGLMVPSIQVTPSTTGATVRALDSGVFPLFTKLGPTYVNAGTELTYQVLHGKQPKGMRWRARDVSNVTHMKVSILDDSGTPLVLAANAKMELVFDVTWSDAVNQSQLWRTDKIYMNAMNG